MLLTRIWFLLLALAGVAGLSTALLSRGLLNREHLAATDESLRRDRFEIESLLKLDARARLDTLAPIAADGTVREAVRERGKNRIEGQDGQKALKDRLRTMNQRLEELRADLLIAVAADGTIIAQEGKKPPREGAGLGKVPLVERALSGFMGDDVWVYDGGVYRMAARPIVDRGQYVGAIIHGQRLDAVLAQRLSERLGGSTVAFFLDDKVIATYAPTDVPGAPTQTELAAVLKSEALGDERLKKGERTEAFDLGGRARAVYSLVAGSASAANVGYAIARPYTALPTPWAIFDEATKEDVDGLPKAQLAVYFVLLFALAMGIMFLERDRPLAIFRREVEKLAEGKAEEMDLAAMNRAYRRIGERVHAALDTLAEKGGGPRRKQKANLDQILGPAPESLTSSAFSFGSESDEPETPQEPVALPAPISLSAPVPLPAPVAYSGAPAATSVPAPHKVAGLPSVPSSSSSASSGAPRVPPPAPRIAPGPTSKMPIPSVSTASRLDDKSVMLRLDGSGESEEEEATVIAEVPDQLRQAARDDEAYFREVFDQYLALRHQCGESVAELSFEKFKGTLRKNRDQIMLQRPDAKDVRFTVYVKAGKAALKASPVKP